MNKLIKWVTVSVGVLAVTLLSGCATNLYPGGPSVGGFIYTGVTDPAQKLAVAVEPGPGTKVGEASANGILGLIAVGDASLEAAMKNGGITKVHHVDHRVNLILGGLWVQTTTIIHGE
jgi:hypothetical protein